MSEPPPTVCVFLKAPVCGEVKTRLAKEVGEKEALRIYRGLVEHQLAEIPSEWRVEIHFTPVEEESRMRSWLGGRVRYFPQPAGGLGERLAFGQAEAFRRGATLVFLIGGDCPELLEEHLRGAAHALKNADGAITPTTDGGYALLATTRPLPRLFQDIKWSTPEVFAQTLARAREANLRMAVMERLTDVDTLADWEHVKHRIRGERTGRAHPERF